MNSDRGGEGTCYLYIVLDEVRTQFSKFKNSEKRKMSIRVSEINFSIFQKESIDGREGRIK